MVCQNQNLAESEAPLAVDMKEKIREMLEAGKTEKEIKSFFLERKNSKHIKLEYPRGGFYFVLVPEAELRVNFLGALI